MFMVVPRLLHVNQEGLPGYLGNQVPSGIFNHTIDRQSQIFTEKLFPTLITQRNERLNPVIHSLLLVGSVGSIAQNKNSDLDYTLLVDGADISDQGMELLQRKLRLIETWALETFDLELHFFINDCVDVKNNIFGESDGESTGSALAKMLKEEMYRTMILAAGKIPFWWIVPVVTDDEKYDRLFDQVNEGKTLLNKDDFIDMGNIADISDGEFFGGAIWTLIKSFKSPFKTLLKMGLLEDYTFRKTSFNLLCHQMKEKVFSGNPAVDPYLMLYERVEKFFMDTKTAKETDALRVAFYMKVGTPVDSGELDKTPRDYKQSVLMDKLKLWNWSASQLNSLNAYENWQMNRKTAMGKRINNILMTSYESISEKNKTLDPSETLITKRDTHLLGRKLFSFYRKAPNKVENLFSVVDGHTAEAALTFLLDKKSSRGNPVWSLIRGKTTAQVEQVDPENVIKKTASLPFLIAFAAFNQLFRRTTDLFIKPDGPPITKLNLNIILNQLNDFLGQVNITAIHNKDLLSPVRIAKLYLIVDFGIPVAREIYMGNINQCKSNEDLEQFIVKRINRIKSITAIYLTSWGELFCKSHSGLNAMNRCMEELSVQTAPETISRKNFLKIFIPSNHEEIPQVPWLNQYAANSLNTRKAPTAHQRAG